MPRFIRTGVFFIGVTALLPSARHSTLWMRPQIPPVCSEVRNAKRRFDAAFRYTR